MIHFASILFLPFLKLLKEMKCLPLIFALSLLRVVVVSADSAVTITAGGRTASATVPAGTVRVSYRIKLITTDIDAVTDPALAGGSIFFNLTDAAGNIVYQEQYTGPTHTNANAFFETNPISFEFHNPVDRAIQVMVVGARYFRSGNFLSRIGLNYFVTQPDNRSATQITVETGPPTETGAPNNNPTPLPGQSGSKIHAVLVSGRFAPEHVLRIDNKTTLYGALIALGAVDDGLKPIDWPTGLLIVPDHDLLTGAKIPPIIPNVADVRIRHYSSQATIEPATNDR
jgi:hypothetical protein